MHTLTTVTIDANSVPVAASSLAISAMLLALLLAVSTLL